MSQHSRRAFLGAGVGAALLAATGRARAFGAKSKLHLAQWQYSGGNYAPRPTALRRLAWEIDKRTSIDVALEPIQLRIADKQLHQHPLLFVGGDRGFDALADADVARLQRYLAFGGMLVIDSADPRPGGGFDRSVRTLVAQLFPSQKLQRLTPGHVVYKSFYLLDRPFGRVATTGYLEGIERDGRVQVLYCMNDLCGAWARDNFGQWEFGVHPGGERQRELAFRLGINIAMYALCSDYKTDQVHVPFILRRRRWQVP